jgi:hypothetical protein
MRRSLQAAALPSVLDDGGAEILICSMNGEGGFDRVTLMLVGVWMVAFTGYAICVESDKNRSELAGLGGSVGFSYYDGKHSGASLG